MLKSIFFLLGIYFGLRFFHSPFGVISGGFLGYWFGVALEGLFFHPKPTTHRRPSNNQSSWTSNHRVSVTLINDAILVLMASVMKADGKILKSEVNFVKPYLRQIFGEDTQEALYQLKDLLSTNLDTRAAAMLIGRSTNYEAKLDLLKILISLANADGEFAESERAVLEHIAANMMINKADFYALCPSRVAENGDWAYKILELSPKASDEEVKKAYRRLSMKYHPDKVSNGDEATIKQANEKFDSLRKAYEYIKSRRNFK